jgi:SEC-C motif
VEPTEANVDSTSGRQVGRNEPCPCGSGRKYKHCCLAKDEATAREARVKAEAKVAEKAAKAAEEEGASAEAAPPPPRKPQTYQPWRKTATNTHPFQRMSTPRKVGGS